MKNKIKIKSPDILLLLILAGIIILIMQIASSFTLNFWITFSIMGLAIISAFVFWLWMIAAALEIKERLWAAIIFLIPIASLAFYFIDYRSNIK